MAYLNSKPFIYGIEHSTDLKNYSLSLDMPSVCAEKLVTGQVDIGLVPVAVIPQIPTPYIISDYCIGADGPVNSVMLYSEVPLHEIEEVLLDYQSKTSVMLLRLLMKKWWKITPLLKKTLQGYESKIKNATAALVIGDRTFSLNNRYKYQWDLAEEWKKLTGLPFVFACWVANRPLPDTFTEAFNRVLRYGVENRKIVAAQLTENYAVDIEEYFCRYISYDFNGRKKQALEKFLGLIKELDRSGIKCED